MDQRNPDLASKNLQNWRHFLHRPHRVLLTPSQAAMLKKLQTGLCRSQLARTDVHNQFSGDTELWNHLDYLFNKLLLRPPHPIPSKTPQHRAKQSLPRRVSGILMHKFRPQKIIIRHLSVSFLVIVTDSLTSCCHRLPKVDDGLNDWCICYSLCVCCLPVATGGTSILQYWYLFVRTLLLLNSFVPSSSRFQLVVFRITRTILFQLRYWSLERKSALL